MEGWIKLHRKIISHWIFKNPYYLKAWTLMLINVNYDDKKILINGQLIECKRGQSLLSIDSWVVLFGISKINGNWTYQKVRTFFELLEKDKMICKENIVKTTRITICNYETYQEQQQPNNKIITTKEQPNNNQITTTKERKEVKESKEVKNINIPNFEEFKDYAILKKQNIDLLDLKLKYEAWIENDWKTGKGTKITNWKTTLLNPIPYLTETIKQPIKTQINAEFKR
jgi:hypothetical protein